MDPDYTPNGTSVRLPAPTAWPVILAFGLTLISAGLLTDISLSVVGGVLALVGCIGWFRDVLPHERHETVPVEPEIAKVVTERPEVARLHATHEIERMRIPIEIYPISAGIKGGLAGSAAMAAIAALYGLFTQASIWYPINLLAAVVYADALRLPVTYLTSFHPVLFSIATLLHVVTSVLVGLLYGVMLPMFPRHPILLGGVIAPIIWTGLLYPTLGIINPLLDQRIDWKWFVASQIGFGTVAGLIVARQSRVRTRQFLPFAARAGIVTPGLMDERSDPTNEP
jgi:hypothetical protein